jgi:hypothetical protein
MAGTLLVYHCPMSPVKPFDTYIGILIIRSSHKSSNSNKEEVQSVFHHFCPGLPLSLTLCPISQCSTLSQMISVMGSRRLHSMQKGTGRIPMLWRCVPKQSCPTHNRNSATAFLLSQSGVLAIYCLHGKSLLLKNICLKGRHIISLPGPALLVLLHTSLWRILKIVSRLCLGLRNVLF